MKKALWILTALPIIATAFALQFMPDRIPAHYDFSGEIDRWGSKYELIVFPLVIIAISISWEVIFSIYNKKAQNASEDKQRAEMLNNIKVMKITAVATTALFVALHCFFLYKAYSEADSGLANLDIDGIKVTCFLLGIQFIILGNFIPKTKLNGAIGLRISYSMYNDVTWSKSNRFGGLALMISGVLTVVCSAIFSSAISLVLMLTFLTVSIIVMILYAKKVYEEEKRKRNNRPI